MRVKRKRPFFPSDPFAVVQALGGEETQLCTVRQAVFPRGAFQPAFVVSEDVFWRVLVRSRPQSQSFARAFFDFAEFDKPVVVSWDMEEPLVDGMQTAQIDTLFAPAAAILGVESEFQLPKKLVVEVISAYDVDRLAQRVDGRTEALSFKWARGAPLYVPVAPPQPLAPPMLAFDDGFFIQLDRVIGSHTQSLSLGAFLQLRLPADPLPFALDVFGETHDQLHRIATALPFAQLIYCGEDGMPEEESLYPPSSVRQLALVDLAWQQQQTAGAYLPLVLSFL